MLLLAFGPHRKDFKINPLRSISAFLLCIHLVAAPLTAEEPLNVAILHGPGGKELREFAKIVEADFNMKCTFVSAEKAEQVADSEPPQFMTTPFEGLQALGNCDVILSNLYRTWAPPEELVLLKKEFREKPVVGLRKAHHGFQNWLEADREIFGITYKGHYGFAKDAEIKLLPQFESHPIFADLKASLPSGGCYAHLQPAKDLTIFMTGGIIGQPSQPQTWSRIVKARQNQRVFYTRYDAADLSENESVMTMVVNAIRWAAASKGDQPSS